MKKILIIGLGLIGGSFAKSLKKLDFIEQIDGCDLNLPPLEEAKKLDIIQKIVDLEENLDNYDLIILACPLFSYGETLQNLSFSLKNCKKKPIIIDLGSLKEIVLKEIPDDLKENFIACHPIAGSEKTGFANSSVDLFLGKKFIICKSKDNSELNIKKVENLVKNIGFNVDFIDAKLHDEIYALISHLPQFLSFLTKEFSPKNIKNDFLKNCFRLNDSNAHIWADIFQFNEKNIEKFYMEFFKNLEFFSKKFTQKKFDEIINITQNLSKMLKFDENLAKIDEKTLKNEEIGKILFRLIIVASFARIGKVKDYLNYSGNGFKDFTSIIFLAKENNEILIDLFAKNYKEISHLLDNLISE